MSHATSPLRSLLTGRPRPAPAPVVDPADMGTCFGLEMTLDAPGLVPPPATVDARPWWQRLATRKAPAT